MHTTFRTLVVALVCAFFVVAAPAQSDSQAQTKSHPVGVAFTTSTLGLGGQAAVSLTERVNVRGGFNVFGYSRTFDREGLDYDGRLKLRSVEAIVDWFPFAGAFHLSPGVLLYNGNRFDATLNVPAGDTFDLGDATYRSNPADPVRGGGEIKLNNVAPMILWGWGNLVPRTRHFTVAFESGVAFHGTPKAALNFTGSVCDVSGANCRGVNDAEFQSNVQREQDEVNDDASPFKVWPILRLSVAYRF